MSLSLIKDNVDTCYLKKKVQDLKQSTTFAILESSLVFFVCCEFSMSANMLENFLIIFNHFVL